MSGQADVLSARRRTSGAVQRGVPPRAVMMTGAAGGTLRPPPAAGIDAMRSFNTAGPVKPHRHEVIDRCARAYRAASGKNAASSSPSTGTTSARSR